MADYSKKNHKKLIIISIIFSIIILCIVLFSVFTRFSWKSIQKKIGEEPILLFIEYTNCEDNEDANNYNYFITDDADYLKDFMDGMFNFTYFLRLSPLPELEKKSDEIAFEVLLKYNNKSYFTGTFLEGKNGELKYKPFFSDNDIKDNNSIFSDFLYNAEKREIDYIREYINSHTKTLTKDILLEIVSSGKLTIESFGHYQGNILDSVTGSRYEIKSNNAQNCYEYKIDDIYSVRVFFSINYGSSDYVSDKFQLNTYGAVLCDNEDNYLVLNRNADVSSFFNYKIE